MTTPPTPHTRRRFERTWSVTALAVAMFGMLFWFKLRLSVDIPKQAYAVPEPAVDASGSGDASRERSARTDGAAP